MNLKDLFTICSMICDKHINKNPTAVISYNDQKYLYTDIKQDIENIAGWCHPIELNSIKQVCFCKDCKHYKSCFKGKSKLTICDLDQLQKTPNHYCGYGEENEV